MFKKLLILHLGKNKNSFSARAGSKKKSASEKKFAIH